jgi:hypothetical protein
VDPLGLEENDEKKRAAEDAKAVAEIKKQLKESPSGLIYGPTVGEGIRKQYGDDAFKEENDFGMIFSEKSQRWYRAELQKNDDGSIREVEPGVPELKIDSIKAATEEDYANAAYESYANGDINEMDRRLADDYGGVESVKSAGRAQYAQDYEGSSKAWALTKQTAEDKWFDIALGGAGLAFKKGYQQLVRSFNKNKQKWKLVGAFTEQASRKGARNTGVSIQEVYKNVDTGETIIKHTVVNDKGPF